MSLAYGVGSRLETFLDMKTLQIVAAVAETGSMTEAAHRFGITQSAVSQAVRKAESGIGVALLDRHRRPLTPTLAGRILVSRLQDLSRDFDGLLETLRGVAGKPPRIDLRLGMVDSFAGSVGAPLIKELADGEAALSITVWSGLAGPHAQALADRAIDMAITCDPMDHVDGLDRHLLFRDPYFLVVPRGLGRALQRRELPEVLQRYRLVRHSERSYVGRQVDRHLRRLDLRPPRVFEFDTSDALVAMVATGMGVAITTPLCLLQGAAYAGEVDVVPLAGPALERGLYLVTRQDAFPSLAGHVAQCTRRIMRARVLPRIAALVPWLDMDAFGLAGEADLPVPAAVR